MLDIVMLASLVGGPAYGYALKRTAGFLFGGGELHNNVVYPLLRRFVQRAWVVQKGMPGARGQQRKQYKLTSAGKTQLARRLEDFDDRTAADLDEFLVRVAMLQWMSASARTNLFDRRRAYLEKHSAMLRLISREQNVTGFAAGVLDHLVRCNANELRWIRKLEKQAVVKKGKMATSCS